MHYNTLALLALTAAPYVTAIDELRNSTIPMQCMSICAPIAQLTNICDVNTTTTSGQNSTKTVGIPNMGMTNEEMAKANPMGEMAKGIPGAITVSAGAMIKRLLMGKRDIKREMNMDMDMSGMNNEDMAEMMCICENKSFKVAEVMGLCASCMEMNTESSDKTPVENIDRIMSQCSFPATSFAPSATSILEGVTVQATKPAVTMTGSTSPSGTAMSGMSMGSAGRVEVFASTWSVGMIMVSLGLGLGLVAGVL